MNQVVGVDGCECASGHCQVVFDRRAFVEQRKLNEAAVAARGKLIVVAVLAK